MSGKNQCAIKGLTTTVVFKNEELELIEDMIEEQIQTLTKNPELEPHDYKEYVEKLRALQEKLNEVP